LTRIGILGGTFDPIHYGHLILAEATLDQLRLDRVEFLPANDPPHKPDGSVSPARHRAAMVEAAIKRIDYFALNCIEMERTGPSYTVDTLEQLVQTRPKDEFWFIVGGDSLRDLPTWRSPDRILEIASLAVVDRPGAVYDLNTLEQQLPRLRERVAPVEAPLIDLSATELRHRFMLGGSIRFQTPDAVIEYINANDLYSSFRPTGRVEIAEPA
jgi:nicotinate-nucleotide adenylyltransferase